MRYYVYDIFFFILYTSYIPQYTIWKAYLFQDHFLLRNSGKYPY